MQRPAPVRSRASRADRFTIPALAAECRAAVLSSPCLLFKPAPASIRISVTCAVQAADSN